MQLGAGGCMTDTLDSVISYLLKHGFVKSPRNGWFEKQDAKTTIGADLTGSQPRIGVLDSSGDIQETGHGLARIDDYQREVQYIIDSALKAKSKGTGSAYKKKLDDEKTGGIGATPTPAPGAKANPPEPNKPEPPAPPLVEKGLDKDEAKKTEKGKAPAIAEADGQKPRRVKAECVTCKVTFELTFDEAFDMNEKLGGLYCAEHQCNAGANGAEKQRQQSEKKDAKNMGTDIVKRESNIIIPEKELTTDVIRQYICPDATDAEAYNFLMLCKYRNLNPFTKEAYLIKYKGSPATMVVGKDAFYRKAQESGKLKGIESGIIVRDAEGKIIEREGNFIVPNDASGKGGDVLLGGWAKVYRTDQEKPTVAKVALNEYIKIVDSRPQRNWATMPATMISKVAKVQALREAFTIELGGCYETSEME